MNNAVCYINENGCQKLYNALSVEASEMAVQKRNNTSERKRS